jgi:hypothetical protein
MTHLHVINLTCWIPRSLAQHIASESRARDQSHLLDPRQHVTRDPRARASFADLVEWPACCGAPRHASCEQGVGRPGLAYDGVGTRHEEQVHPPAGSSCLQFISLLLGWTCSHSWQYNTEARRRRQNHISGKRLEGKKERRGGMHKHTHPRAHRPHSSQARRSRKSEIRPLRELWRRPSCLRWCPRRQISHPLLPGTGRSEGPCRPVAFGDWRLVIGDW